MNAEIIKSTSKSIILQIEVPIGDSMLTTENNLQEALNLGGKEVMKEIFESYDTDGSPIVVNNVKHTSKGQVPRIYQTPYGEVNVNRYVYQSGYGGAVYCPLEIDARIINSSTPKFAKMVSSKYSESSASQVQQDFKHNHSRYISQTLIQRIGAAVSKVIDENKNNWKYSPPVEQSRVKTVGVCLDGTCMLMTSGGGYRVAMVGSISLYDEEGERMHTNYTASSPESGKATFYTNFDIEIQKIKRLYPDAVYIGIADGAKDNWTFLQKYVTVQIIDFFHVTEYLSIVSNSIFRVKEKMKEWLDDACHKLKHEQGGAQMLLDEIRLMMNKKMSQDKKEKMEKVIKYFENHIHQMDYSNHVNSNYPIGSGVIEAACKVIVKQRLGNSGMKWSDDGAKAILTLRCINRTDGKWEQVWQKISRHGTKNTSK